mmetsp:Transcript_18019/g.45069  ORF Transcript_18019/g.45069 Transcript_18019/m.45069 type:complete len:231 (+) Transcript_18019:138-830(+)
MKATTTMLREHAVGVMQSNPVDHSMNPEVVVNISPPRTAGSHNNVKPGLRIKHRSQELPRTSSFVAPGTSTSSFVAAADLAQEDGEPLTQGCAKVLRASNQLEAVALKLQQAGPSRFSRRYCPSVFSVVDYAFASDRDIAAAEQLGKKAKPTNAQGAQPADVVGGAVPSRVLASGVGCEGAAVVAGLVVSKSSTSDEEAQTACDGAATRNSSLERKQARRLPPSTARAFL